MNLEQIAKKSPILALLLAPCAGLALVVALPFIGWFVLLRAIVASLRHLWIRVREVARIAIFCARNLSGRDL
jgi:hypothetical protein